MYLHTGNTHALFTACQEMFCEIPPESLDINIREIKSDVADHGPELFNNESSCE